MYTDVRPPYPEAVARKPYPDNYVSFVFPRYDGKIGNAKEHIRRFVDAVIAHSHDYGLRLKDFSKSLEVDFSWYHSCIFRSIPAGTDGKSRTGMQTGTRQPPIPPRVKFRGVSAVSVDFGVFRPVCVFQPVYFLGKLSSLQRSSSPTSPTSSPPAPLCVVPLFFFFTPSPLLLLLILV